MGKQVTVTIRMPNSSTTESRSFFSDLVLVKENVGNEDYPATLFFFGNFSNPLNATEQWLITETVAEAITASADSLVLGTVTGINGSGQTTTTEYAFPCAGFTIASTSVSYAESIIIYRGSSYYVEETQEELVEAANAGDGGGGETPLFKLSGSETATGDVTGNLGENVLAITNSDDTNLVLVNPTSFLTSLSASDGTALTQITAKANSVDETYFQFSSSNGVDDVSIIGDAAGDKIDLGANEINFSAVHFNIDGLQNLANNAAAISGGLSAGDLYYTDTAGEATLKIVI